MTDHDVAAFVDVVAASVGDAGRWVHHGLTSSDVLDTALGAAARARRARSWWAARAAYRDALIARAREHVGTLCVGRTHGIHAEPTTFGVKLAGLRVRGRPQPARASSAPWRRASVGALSGAVGTYAANGPELEAAVLGRLGLAREDVSTQVVARDRHAELLGAVALAGAGLERFATEIRHLQRTEVREVEEPFREGQKGSSAMPHKRNPIVSERITGIARLLRGYAQAGLEDVALWHERDISHSSVERVALPDATILLDYAQHLADAGGGGDDRARRPDAGQPRGHPRRAVLPARAAGAGGVRPLARRRLPDRPGERAARLATRARTFRELLAPAAPEAGPRRDLRPRGVRRPRGRDRRPPGQHLGLRSRQRGDRSHTGRLWDMDPRDRAAYRRAMALLLGSLGVLAFSFSLPATRLAVQDLDATFVGFGRAVVAAMLGAALLALLDQPRARRDQLGSLMLVALGVVIGFPLFTALALREVTAATAP